MALDGDRGVAWLLQQDDPAVRYLTLSTVLGRSESDPQLREARAQIPTSAFAAALLHGQQADGGFGHPSYEYWRGTHWRLLSLAQLGFPPGDDRVAAAFEDEMRSVVAPFAQGACIVDGRVHRHACVEGNALGAASLLGFAGDHRVAALADGLVRSQWPDGGWNNDMHRGKKHSAVYETHEPVSGLTEYHKATGDARALEAARAGAECLLERRLIHSHRHGRPVATEWTKLHHPLYWHYDVLQGLDLLRPLGLLGDQRADGCLEMLVAARNDATGTWRHSGRPRWALPGERASAVDVIDWGRRGPNPFITIRALRVLHAAGRLATSA